MTERFSRRLFRHTISIKYDEYLYEDAIWSMSCINNAFSCVIIHIFIYIFTLSWQPTWIFLTILIHTPRHGIHDVLSAGRNMEHYSRNVVSQFHTLGTHVHTYKRTYSHIAKHLSPYLHILYVQLSPSVHKIRNISAQDLNSFSQMSAFSL